MLGQAQRTALDRLVRDVAAREILPRFQNLTSAEIETKSSPRDLVTVADRAAEEALTPALEALLPGSVVVGEEAVAADSTILDRLLGAAPVWLVDPVDGTANFVEGSSRFGVMVALCHGQETLFGLIYSPVDGAMAWAARAEGAWLDGQRMQGGAPKPLEEAHAEYSSTYLDTALRPQVDAVIAQAASQRAGHCSAHAYLECAKGEADLVIQYLMTPWDHAAGALLVEEAGGKVQFVETAAAYTPIPRDPALMLATSSAANWDGWANGLLGL